MEGSDSVVALGNSGDRAMKSPKSRNFSQIVNRDEVSLILTPCHTLMIAHNDQ